jgi:hypothetical protein
MTSDEFVTKFVDHYKLVNFLKIDRCYGRNIYYKKLLIYILRHKFSMSFPKIAKVFDNTHAAVMFNYKTFLKTTNQERNVEDAMKLYVKDKA